MTPPAPRGPRRVVILAEGKLHPLTAKTACCFLRVRRDEVVAVLDSTRAGRTCQQVLGYGGDVPVLASLEEARRLDPDTLLIGIAPKGGILPAAWREVVLEAIRAGMDVWSGLHTFLADDPQCAREARERGVRLWDLRRPPEGLNVPTGALASFRGWVVHTVGTDCDTGKMTVAWELAREARARGMAASFAATGQTGVLLAGRGIVVDRVAADFVAGAAERIVLEAAGEGDVVFVEGQGTLAHPAYSGVTLGLLHGSRPDALVLCHHPGRASLIAWGEDTSLAALHEQIRRFEDAAAWLKPAPVVAIAINGFDLEDGALEACCRRVAEETGRVATDPIRFGAGALLDAVLRHRERAGRETRGAPGRTPRTVPGRKAGPAVGPAVGPGKEPTTR